MPERPLAERLLKKVNKAVHEYDLIGDGDRIVVAVSGGGDGHRLDQSLGEQRPAWSHCTGESEYLLDLCAYQLALALCRTHGFECRAPWLPRGRAFLASHPGA